MWPWCAWSGSRALVRLMECQPIVTHFITRLQKHQLPGARRSLLSRSWYRHPAPLPGGDVCTLIEFDTRVRGQEAAGVVTVASNSCFAEHSAAAMNMNRRLRSWVSGNQTILSVATGLHYHEEGENYPESRWCDHVPPPPILPIIFCNNLWPEQRLETLSVCRHKTHGGKPGHHLDVS